MQKKLAVVVEEKREENGREGEGGEVGGRCASCCRCQVREPELQKLL